jgi:hypothetical protein
VSELPLGLQGVTGVAVAMLPTSLAFLSQEIRVMRGYDCTNHAKDVLSGVVIREYI